MVLLINVTTLSFSSLLLSDSLYMIKLLFLSDSHATVAWHTHDTHTHSTSSNTCAPNHACFHLCKQATEEHRCVHVASAAAAAAVDDVSAPRVNSDCFTPHTANRRLKPFLKQAHRVQSMSGSWDMGGKETLEKKGGNHYVQMACSRPITLGLFHGKDCVRYTTETRHFPLLLSPYFFKSQTKIVQFP